MNQAAPPDIAVRPTAPAMGVREFIALITALQATSGLGTDLMLPALAGISRDLHVAAENERQFVIGAYLLGLGLVMIFYGPLADRFGRRKVILSGLIGFVAMNLVAGFAKSFEVLIAARFIQGMAGASMRTLAVTIVRDRFSGRQMARVMSLSMTVALLVPILAPGAGQILALILSWRGIFWALALFSAAIAVWLALRLPETLAEEDRAPLTIGRTATALRLILTNRISLGYTLAGSILYGALLSFIFSVQQIFEIGFKRPDLLAISYAVIGGTMAVGALSNARLVERYGMRRLAHSAMAGLIVITALHSLTALGGWETVWSLILFQSLQMFCFGLSWPNFSSMAMQPMGHVAGTAASTQSTISTVGGVCVGTLIGQSFDGTTVPIAVGFFAASLAAFGIAAVVERGRLFGQPDENGNAGRE